MSTNKKKVTITDVAKAANVSVATVSRILNNRDGKIKISEKTKQRVLTTANELGYQLNPFAASLRTNRTGVIGAIIRDISDPFLVKIAKGVHRAAQSKGIELFLANTDYQRETAHHQLHLMVNHWFDGLIILDNLSKEDPFIQMIQQRNVPFVSITGENNSALKPVVHTDDIKGVQMALDHLMALGHQRIGYIGSDLAGVKGRLNYFQDYMHEKNLDINGAYIQAHASSRTDISSFIEKVIQLEQSPTALFCATDVLAIKVINIASQFGLRVPRDLSIIGFDDIDEASEYYPALTTIKQPSQQLSSQAVDLLMDIINGQENEREVIIEPELIVRESTSHPNK